MRRCRKCKSEYPLCSFPKAGEINGVRYYRHLCRKCYSESKRPVAEKARARFREFKKTLSCERCGNSDHRVLEFHHIDRKTKSRDVSLIRGSSVDRINTELSKCTVLCANCHRIETWDEMGWKA